jgi:tetratricopeptide (TPR) repeat protein
MAPSGISSILSLSLIIGIFVLLYYASQKKVDPSFLFDGVETQAITGSDMIENIQSLTAYIESLNRTSLIPGGGNSDKARKLKAWAYMGYFASTIEATNKHKNITSIENIVEYYDHAVEIYENHFQHNKVSTVGDVMYFIYMQQSKHMEALGNVQGAKFIAEKAIRLSSTNSEEAAATCLHADLLLSLSDVSSALKEYQYSLSIKPYDLSIYDKIVKCHKHLGTLSKNKWRMLFTEIDNLVKEYKDLNVQMMADDENRTDGRTG